MGSLSSQSVTFSHLNHAWQILEEVRALRASAGFSLALDAAGLTRQTGNLHPDGPHPFQGICCICYIVQPLALTVASQRPTQNQGCQSQPKSHVFQLLRDYCPLENTHGFLQLSSPRAFFLNLLGQRGIRSYGMLPEAWQHLQVGLKKSKMKLVQRGVMALLYKFAPWHALCKPRGARWRMCVQPNRSDGHREQTRSCHTLRESWTHQQATEAQTAPWHKTASRSDSTSSSH